MTRTLRATAPCRADLAGGTLDIWPLGLLHPGAVTVNVALPVPVTLEVSTGAPAGTVVHRDPAGRARRLGAGDADHDLTAAICFDLVPEGGLTVTVFEQAPVGSGLGGSSTYGVALASAAAEVSKRSLSDDDIVRTVRDIEARILHTPTGTQDHLAAQRGGIHALHLDPGGPFVERLDVDIEWLAPRLTVFFTGITHHSGMVNWQVFRRRMENDPETVEALGAIARAAVRCREALLAADTTALADSLRTEWSARRRLAPEVCPDDLDRIERRVVEAGASAFKACGAGGGGSVLVVHEPERRSTIADALLEAAPSGRIFPEGIEPTGCRVESPQS